MSPNDAERIFSKLKFDVKNYTRGTQIFSPEDYENKIGFIISGKCEIIKSKHDGAKISLNILHEKQSFGILAALSACDEYPTTVVAKTSCDVLFISQKEFMNLVESEPKVAVNVIKFLSQKLSFLNKKIATFSADTVEEKLALFLLSEAKRQSSTTIVFNCKKCSEVINAGRASVYRALDDFTGKKLIHYENKKIIILDLKGLERTQK